MATQCPVCGDADKPKFERSNWCVDCTTGELKLQKSLDSPRQAKQLIERGVGIREVLN